MTASLVISDTVDHADPLVAVLRRLEARLRELAEQVDLIEGEMLRAVQDATRQCFEEYR